MKKILLVLVGFVLLVPTVLIAAMGVGAGSDGAPIAFGVWMFFRIAHDGRRYLRLHKGKQTASRPPHLTDAVDPRAGRLTIIAPQTSA